LIAFDNAINCNRLLELARRNLGLFQHHDGITGTAKDFVVVDYGTRLMKSVMDCKKVGRWSDTKKNDRS